MWQVTGETVPSLPGRGRDGARTAGSTPERLERVIATVDAAADSITVLVGDAGNGKAYLAEQAAMALAERPPGEANIVVLPEPPRLTNGVVSVFATGFPALFSGSVGVARGDPRGDPSDVPPRHSPGDTDDRQDAGHLAELIWDRLAGDHGATDLILVAPGIDEYAPGDVSILEHLVHDRRLRLIATARHMNRSVERISRGPRAKNLPIGPLSLSESEHYVAGILGVDLVEAETLRRWYAVSEGNTYALEMLALASDQAGVLKRSRGVAWVATDDDTAPPGFADAIAGTCTEAEWRMLELIALAEPIHETAILRSLEAVVLSILFDRELVLSRPRPGGGVLLVTAHPLLGASLRARLSPVRRIQLNDQIFRLLDDERGTVDPVYSPDLLVRLVVFGLEGGHSLPIAWAWAAFELMARGGDSRLVLRLALAVAVHPEADATQAGVAILLGGRVARSIGDEGSLRSAYAIIQSILADSARTAEISPTVHVSLQLAALRQRMWDEEEVDRLLAAHEEVLDDIPDEDRALVELVRSSVVLTLAYTGRIREAAEAGPDPEPSTDLKIEWVRSPARAVGSLILEQQGRIAMAIRSAENARKLSQLGARARAEFVDFQGFCWLLGYWVGGSTDAAHQVLDELAQGASATTHAETYYSGLVEAGTVLLGVQDGRWRESAQCAELLLDRLSRHDGYGLESLIQAASALALAVLGDRDGAIRAIHAAEVPRRGIGLALSGYRRLLLLRARQWLRTGDLVGEAAALAEWAADERLPLIELQALHAIAYESQSATEDLIDRARELAAQVDPPLGEAFVAHIERLAAGTGEDATDSEEPEIRLLAEFGIWLPMPPAAELTAREREVVLLAALGHSSRFIAERLHISVRTVETHLSNVFAKLGLDNRDDLRRWVGRERRYEAD